MKRIEMSIKCFSSHVPVTVSFVNQILNNKDKTMG